MPGQARHDEREALASQRALPYIALTLFTSSGERGCGAGSAAPDPLTQSSSLTDIAALTRLIEPHATALGFALVRVRLFGGGDDRTLQVMAERPDTRQLTIDDCTALSHRLSDMLDALEGTPADPIDSEYRLEVSSPGIDRPLTRLADFAEWAGHEARITLAEKLDGRKQFKGDLGEVEPTGAMVSIVSPDGVNHLLPFDLIADAKLTITDRLLAATQPLSSAGADEFETEAPADGADPEEEPADSAEEEEQN